MASLLLLAYPFTVYVVANFAALQHLIVIFWPHCCCWPILSRLLSKLCRFAAPDRHDAGFVGRSGGTDVRTRQRRWFVVMLVVSILAPPFHEAGVVIGPLLLSEIVILDRRVAWQRKRSLAWLLISAKPLSRALVGRAERGQPGAGWDGCRRID